MNMSDEYANMCLLGLQDTELPEKEMTKGYCIFSNKLGGYPDWLPYLELPSNPFCKVCLKETLFICQVYCPIGETAYHRMLYVFCCLQPTCLNKSHSWQVLRSQWRMLHPEDSGDESVDHAPDSWLDEAEYWDEPDQPFSLEDIREENKTSQNSNLEMACLGLNNLRVTELGPPPSIVFANRKNELINVQDIPKDYDDFDSTEYYPHKEKKLRFISYYIYFSPLLRDINEELLHAEFLMKQYELQSGITNHNLHNKENSREQCHEAYEKGEVKHGNNLFHKFSMKVSENPRQIIRYHWQATPLHMTAPDNSVPNCEYCGSKRAYEMQLMPYLINCLQLRDAKSEGPELDFGTVIIWSCIASCWKEGDRVREEHVYVQNDPDNALYEKLSERYSSA